MRPSSLPRLIVAQTTPSAVIGEMADSPYSTVSMHSRNSSGTSDNYSPLTQTFSFHEHTRHPSSSSSSLATTPPKYEPSIESLNNRISRTTLHDLVEDPHEREDAFDLCADAFEAGCQCGLERTQSNNDMYYLSETEMSPRLCNSTSALERPSLDYSLADGPSEFSSDNEAPLNISKTRQPSADSPVSGLASRVGSRLSSFSKRRDRTPTSPPASNRLSTKSAPASRMPSRAPSFRLSTVVTPVVSPVDVEAEKTPVPTPDTCISEPSNPLEIHMPRPDDPIDRKALASTPLLPVPIHDPEQSDDDVVQSPLQSPTVADNGHMPHLSMIGPSMSSPILSEMALVSPALSAQASATSLGVMSSSQVMSTPDIPSMSINSPQDKWAKKLGHANFSVFPEPYLPETYDMRACRKLYEDWESARRQFMHQAARTSEHYGPTSQVYKYTERKWAEIDAQWKRNHELVVAKTAANGETPIFQPLAEPSPVTKLPALDDSSKFPRLEGSDIVGPMVKYAKITSKPSSKKSAFLKFFNNVRSPGDSLGRTGLSL